MSGLAPAPEVTAAADAWPLIVAARTTTAAHPRGPGVTQIHLTCGRDAQAIFCLCPDVSAGAYVAGLGDIRAHVILHLRQCHEGQIPGNGAPG